jgi:hypothetical protein
VQQRLKPHLDGCSIQHNTIPFSIHSALSDGLVSVRHEDEGGRPIKISGLAIDTQSRGSILRMTRNKPPFFQTEQNGRGVTTSSGEILAAPSHP